MPDQTPVYGLRYQTLSDAPHGPNLGDNLATDVETELIRIDALIVNLAAGNAFASSGTDDTTTSTTFTSGTPVVGVAFTAPNSGRVFVTMSAYVSQTIDGQAAICSWALRTGGSIGSGGTVLAATSDRAIVAGRAVNSGAPALAQGSRRTYVTGLTPGASYNTQIEFQTTATGSCTVFVREILVEPAN